MFNYLTPYVSIYSWRLVNLHKTFASVEIVSPPSKTPPQCRVFHGEDHSFILVGHL